MKNLCGVCRNEIKEWGGYAVTHAVCVRICCDCFIDLDNGEMRVGERIYTTSGHRVSKPVKRDEPEQRAVMTIDNLLENQGQDPFLRMAVEANARRRAAQAEADFVAGLPKWCKRCMKITHASSAGRIDSFVVIGQGASGGERLCHNCTAMLFAGNWKLESGASLYTIPGGVKLEVGEGGGFRAPDDKERHDTAPSDQDLMKRMVGDAKCTVRVQVEIEGVGPLHPEMVTVTSLCDAPDAAKMLGGHAHDLAIARLTAPAPSGDDADEA